MTSDPKHAVGEDILRATMELVDGLEFDGIDGGLARTEQLFISVRPDHEDDPRQAFDATLTCQAMWHQKVDWQLLRVSVRPKNPGGFFVQHVLPLTANGTATFRSLEPGTYLVKAYSHLINFTAPKFESSNREPEDVTELALGVAMGRDGESQTPDGGLIRSDGDFNEIHVLRGTRDSFVTLEFASNNDELDGKTMEFCITNPNTHEIYLDAQTTVFEPLPQEAPYRYKTQPIEISLSPDDEIEVSYRLV